MHPIHWLFTHPTEAQVINILVTSFLTLTLIVITFQYARITARSVRVVEADIRARLKPIPHVAIATSRPVGPVTPKQQVIVTIRTENAPLRIVGLNISFNTPTRQLIYFESFRQNIVEIGTAFTGSFEIDALPVAGAWSVEFTYKDLSNFLIYTTSFDKNGFLGENNPIDPRTLYNRIRFRIRYCRLWLRQLFQ
jgi:hypothetical protein